MSLGKPIAFGATTKTDASRHFYRDVLGLSLVTEDDYAIVFETCGTELRIQKLHAFTPQPFTMLGWEVEHLEAALDALAPHGVTGEHFAGLDQDERGIWRSPSGARLAWVKDPDGNMIAFRGA